MQEMKKTFLNLLESKSSIYIPNQNKVSLPIIYSIYKNMKQDLLFKPICVSDNLIVEGHHRYISAILADYQIEVIKNYPKPGIVKDLIWKDLEFVDEDWDTPFKIQMLNEEDAKYNGISIEVIIEIIK